MACTLRLVTRLFRRRQPAGDFVVPALPIEHKRPELSTPIARWITSETKNENTLLLGCLQQGCYTLVYEGIPVQHDTNELEPAVTRLAGFIGYSFRLVESKNNLVVSFASTEDATMALATHPAIDLGNGNMSVGRHTDMEDEVDGPARKKMKLEEPSPPLPKCQICGDDLSEEVVNPCFYCKEKWCHDCVGKLFTMALSEPDRFPARCCGKALHYDVVRGIISTPDYIKYRERFEQHNTTKPVYCAKSSCSAFLPPRIAKPNAKGQINCPECENTTCVKCHIVVDAQAEHQCVLADETTALLIKFGYKSCPCCSAGVAKMFGCPHVRCQCGAHWCWECQRPIQICWQRPCEGSRDDYNEYDEEESDMASEDEAESATDLAHQEANATPGDTVPTVVVAELTDNAAPTHNTEAVQAAIQPVNPEAARPQGTDTPAAPVVEEDLQNLDDEDADEWENGEFDFGDEPIDESWDTWGCMHRLNPVITKNVWGAHREWIPNTIDSARLAKQIDCQRCYKTIVLVEPSVEKESVEKHERKDSACDVTTTVDQQQISESAAASITSEKKKRKAKKKSERPELYNCAKCGMFYCLPCNKAVIKEIHNSKHSVRRGR